MTWNFCLDLSKGKCNCSCNGTFHKGGRCSEGAGRELCCVKLSLYRGGLGGSRGVVTLDFFFFSKTTILNGHLGNRVKQEIVFTFGKGFKEETKKEAACDCGL